MKPNNPYRPNYKKLYPVIEDYPEVHDFMKTDDRKREYAEYDRKHEKFVEDQEEMIAYFIPSQEDSYERLVEEEKQQFACTSQSVEDLVLHEMEYEHLYACLKLLSESERDLIMALYFKNMTETAYGNMLGISQPAVYKRRRKIEEKLKILMKA